MGGRPGTSGTRHAASRGPLLIQWILCGCSDVNQRADIVWTGIPVAAEMKTLFAQALPGGRVSAPYEARSPTLHPPRSPRRRMRRNRASHGSPGGSPKPEVSPERARDDAEPDDPEGPRVPRRLRLHVLAG